jgi:hypothetical protein
VSSCGIRRRRKEGFTVPDEIEGFDPIKELKLHIVPENEDDPNNRLFWMHTHGMLKHGHPELEIHNVDILGVESTGNLLNGWAKYCIDNKPMKAGETVLEHFGPVAARIYLEESTSGDGPCINIKIGEVFFVCHDCQADGEPADPRVGEA